MTTVDAGGVALEVWRSTPSATAPADRPVVVCIHGLVLDDLASFYFTLGGTLAEVADVVLYDLRGHGRSELLDAGYRVEDHVRDLFALLETLGVDRPVTIVANSYGGAVALAAALASPERVASIVMIEAHYPVEGWGDEMAGTLALVATQLNPEAVMRELGLVSRRKAARIASRADALINHSSLRDDLLGERPLLAEELASIACPVLCCYGTESDLIDRGRRLAALVPDAALEEFAGATHSVLTERTPELRELVVSWVAEHATEPSTLVIAGGVP